MRRARRTGIVLAVGLSVAAHLALIAALGAYAPLLFIPDDSGPPEPVIPILLAPPRMPAHAPSPIRLHRRPQRHVQHVHEVAPLAVKDAMRPTPAPPGPVTIIAEPVAPPQQVAAALRGLRGLTGCSNPDNAGLSREEREACDRRLAAGAKQAPIQGLALGAGKTATLDRDADRKAADDRYKRAFPTQPGKSGPGGQIHDPGADERPDLKLPF